MVIRDLIQELIQFKIHKMIVCWWTYDNQLKSVYQILIELYNNKPENIFLLSKYQFFGYFKNAYKLADNPLYCTVLSYLLILIMPWLFLKGALFFNWINENV